MAEKKLTLETLKDAVAGSGTAFRCSVTLQPAAGEGTKVFPPTYAGSVYATEKRRLPGYNEPVECVLLDSVQSQANRMEEALLQAIDAGRLEIPLIEVDFTPFYPGDRQPDSMRLLDAVGKITSLEVPHRVADAILRESLLDGTPFRDSDPGKRIGTVSARDATALFELCPTALIFGMWDSTGPKGGLGAKFERAVVSEVVGIDATYGLRTASRVDPVIRKNPTLYETPNGDWTVLESQAVVSGAKKEPKKYGKKLSELNLGNVTPDFKDKSGQPYPGGVTIAKAEQSIVLSLPALRRLRFPAEKNYRDDLDNAARTVLAALGLCAASLAAEAGLDLRSRCLLWPTEQLRWELLTRPGEKLELAVSVDQAIRLLDEAVTAAKALGLPWRTERLKLTPSPRLIETVVKSQQLAVQQAGDSGAGGE